MTKEELKTLYSEYKYGKVTREKFMDALLGAYMKGELQYAEYKKYRDDVTADLYIEESC